MMGSSGPGNPDVQVEKRSRVPRRTLFTGLAAAAGGTVGLAGVAASERWRLAGPPIAGVAPQAGPPPVAAASVQHVSDGALEVALTAQEAEWELAPGKRVRALTYTGQVPGPAIRVREGQRLRVTFTNRLAVPSTIHWHGVDVPNPMDGVPDVTQPPVQPGDRFVYEFEARPAGTRWYHTHFAEVAQLDRGLYAPLVVEPAEPERHPPDREYTLVLSAWVTGLSAPVPGQRSGGMMGGMTRPPYDTFAVNGKAYPATAPLAVRQGERVRLRLINASGGTTHLVYLEGHRLRVTHTDGNPLRTPVEVDAVPVAPSERYDVEFTADRPGVWSLHDLAPGHTGAGLRVPVVYEGYEGRVEAPLRPNARGLTVWAYAMGRGVERLPGPSGSRRSYALTLSGGMMGSNTWTINGKTYPNTDPLWVSGGDLVRLRLLNMSMEDHPMHLHGHSFRVTSVAGRALAAPLVKDVVDVQPMEAVEVEFVADNPGDWLFHCHILMHMHGGLAALVRYRA